MNTPNRASDAGPESMARCQKCDASLRKHSAGACIVCEGPCCDACGVRSDKGWYCDDCLKQLAERIAEDLRADMGLGAKL